MTDTVARKRHAKRQALLGSALALFAERGYHATRMADIANELGLQKAAMYYYFDSKEAVLVDLVRTRVGTALEEVTMIAEGPLPVGAKIDAAVAAHLHVFQRHGDIYTIFSSEKLHTISPEAASIVDDLGRRYEEVWASLIEAGIADGFVRGDVDVAVAVKAVLGMLNATVTWYDPSGRIDIDELSRQFSEFVTGALGPAPSA